MCLLQICDAILASGQIMSQRNRLQEHSPLMYEWYQEEYVGAAHGLAGIYYYLMQVNTLTLQTAGVSGVLSGSYALGAS